MVKGRYSKILVPYDGSKFSLKALETAMMLAKAFGSTLHLATVVDVTRVHPPGLIRTKSSHKTFKMIRSNIMDSAKKALQEKEKKCKENGISAITIVKEGSIIDQLLKIIKRNNIDLVVIGSRGLSGFSRLMALGSVSRRISELSDCPVIIVR